MIAQLAAALALAQSGGSIIELQIDMTKGQVIDVIGPLGAPDPTWTGSEEKHDIPGGTLFLCEGRVHTVIMDMSDSVMSFSRLVTTETEARGEPAYKFQYRALGAVEATWRLAPYKYLTVSLSQYRDGPIIVQRTLHRLGPCGAPAK